LEAANVQCVLESSIGYHGLHEAIDERNVLIGMPKQKIPAARHLQMPPQVLDHHELGALARCKDSDIPVSDQGAECVRIPLAFDEWSLAPPKPARVKPARRKLSCACARADE
jgi:hypothetical protein